jgi:hypothetical protein
MASDSADFLIDLGDTWMTDKYKDDFKSALKQYVAQRYYFGSLCHSVPLFLTLGNHDGEAGQPGKTDMLTICYSGRLLHANYITAILPLIIFMLETDNKKMALDILKIIFPGNGEMHYLLYLIPFGIHQAIKTHGKEP